MNTYDNFVKDSMKWTHPTYLMLGLAGETGEVLEKCKKLHRKYGDRFLSEMGDDEALDLLDELGDVLWYTTALSQMFGHSLYETMLVNGRKLANRGRLEPEQAIAHLRKLQQQGAVYEG